jgi:tRNA(fMet)-specific endonuclease VapC
VAVSTITLGELAFGAELSHREQEGRRVATLIQDFVTLPFTAKEAWTYGEIRGDLHRKGTPIGALDMMIAAVAKANDLVLVTHNLKDFERIPELHLKDWQA